MNCVDLTSEFTFEAEEDATVRLQQIDAELHEVNEVLVIHPIKFRQIMIAITWCIVWFFTGITLSESSKNGLGVLMAVASRSIDHWLAQVENEIERLLGKQKSLLSVRAELQERDAADKRAPKADWQSKFPWDGQVQSVLEAIFKLSNFRYVTRAPSATTTWMIRRHASIACTKVRNHVCGQAATA